MKTLSPFDKGYKSPYSDGLIKELKRAARRSAASTTIVKKKTEDGNLGYMNPAGMAEGSVEYRKTINRL